MSDSLEQLQLRERELTELRNKTLQSLEHQVAAREREISTLNEQTLEHVELLQKQLQTARAAPNTAAAIAATAFGTKTVVTMPPGAAAGAVPSTTSPGQRTDAAAAAAVAEVTFLRQRVKDLTITNMNLRRRVMQLEAAIAAGAAVAGTGAAAGFPLFDMLGALDQGNTTSANADADAGATGPTAAAESPLAGKVQQLQQDLDRSRSQLAAARAENEKVMELSSEVRSQRDRYAMQLAALMATSAAAAAGGALPPPPTTDGELWRKQDFRSPPSPTFGESLPVNSPPHPLPLILAATAALSLPSSPIQTSPTSLATLLPLFVPSQNPPLGGSIDAGLYGYQYPYGLVSPWGVLPAGGALPGPGMSYWLPVQPLPGAAAGADRVMKGSEHRGRQSADSGVEEGGSDHSGKSAGRSASPPTRRVAFDDAHSLRRSASQSPPRPGNIPSHSTNANHVRQYQTRLHSSPDPNSHSRSLVTTFDLAAAAAASNTQGSEDRPSGTDANLTVGPVRAAPARVSPPVGLTASGRETQSQRAALRALHRRREHQQNQAAAAVATAAVLRQRVRSYTVVRDEGGAEDAGVVTTTSWPTL
ncbi:hypothetical protein Vafri_12578 [Volvox africanus]|uniref:Uncharacterized protein n=1 Tax=Volvox africanus TaxID=51714 RepID=A0A8J4F5K5_9CHLO|nr:hypothetical protein Vafri_12578 [Volvox africanus]